MNTVDDNDARTSDERRRHEEVLHRRAAAFLDAETEAQDAATRASLARARVAAGAARRRQWLGPRGMAWGGAGLGLALAASFTALVVLPNAGPQAPATDAALTALVDAHGNDAFDAAFNDVASTSDADAALAEDLAFVAWLEENHDAG